MFLVHFSAEMRASVDSDLDNLEVLISQIRGSIVVNISACHAEDPDSIPGRGVLFIHDIPGSHCEAEDADIPMQC